MGDTGSLALGGALGAVAILLKTEFLLAVRRRRVRRRDDVGDPPALRVQVPREAVRARVRAGAPGLPARAAASPLRDEGLERDAGRRALLDHRHPRAPSSPSARSSCADDAGRSLTAALPADWTRGEIASSGSARSGRAAARAARPRRRRRLRVRRRHAADARDDAPRRSTPLGVAVRRRRPRPRADRARGARRRQPRRPARRAAARRGARGGSADRRRDRDRAAVPARLSATSPSRARTARRRRPRSSAHLLARSATTRGDRRQHRHAARRGRARATAPPDWVALEAVVVPAARHAEHRTRASGVLTNLVGEPPRPLRERRGVLRRQGADVPQRADVATGCSTPTIAECRRRWSRGVPGHASAASSVPRAARRLLRPRRGRSSSSSASRSFARGELTLLGDHNVANALAAALAVMARGPRRIATREARGRDRRRRCATFRALEHRIEPVGELRRRARGSTTPSRRTSPRRWSRCAG